MGAVVRTIPTPTTPIQPEPGDILVGCAHLTGFAAHYFYVGSSGFHFHRPTETEERWADWVLVCDSCFVKYGACMEDALSEMKIPIDRDAVWTTNDQFELKRFS
jgi:hypothetical protein